MGATKQSQRQAEEDRRALIELLMQNLENYRYNKQLYAVKDGKSEIGLLLDSDACELLVRWWKDTTKLRQRGRPRLLPSLFGNPYKEEFEREKQKIVAARGKERGATKEATAILAERYGVEPDTMRKRIKRR